MAATTTNQEIENELIEMGFDVCENTNVYIKFMFNGWVITYYYKRQWASGRGITDGRGWDNLLKQIKPVTSAKNITMVNGIDCSEVSTKENVIYMVIDGKLEMREIPSNNYSIDMTNGRQIDEKLKEYKTKPVFWINPISGEEIRLR